MTIKALVVLAVVSYCCARQITIVNNCKQTIWPVFNNVPNFGVDSWEIPAGQSQVVPFERLISGRIWARTGCKMESPCPNDASIARCLKCEVGDCPLGHDRYARGETGMYCHETGGLPPFDIFEMTSGVGGSNDFYDLSRVDGSVGNIAVKVHNYSYVPPTGDDPKYLCGNPSCQVHPRELCPDELQKFSGDGTYIGCYSICKAVNDEKMRAKSSVLRGIWDGVTKETRDEKGVRTRGGLPMKDHVCCACGDGHGGCEVDHNSNFCCSPYIPQYDLSKVGGRCFHEDWPLPNPDFMNRILHNEYWMSRFRALNLQVNYASIFKVVCPDSYSWQFDDFKSTYQCRDADYTVVFCANSSPPGPSPPGPSPPAPSPPSPGGDCPSSSGCWTCPPGQVHHYDIFKEGCNPTGDRCGCMSVPGELAGRVKNNQCPQDHRNDCWTCPPGQVHWFDIYKVNPNSDACACVSRDVCRSGDNRMINSLSKRNRNL